MIQSARTALARSVLRVAPPALGTLWAGALVVLGLWVLQSVRHDPASAWGWAGIFLLTAGQFVFMVVVADRLLAPRRPTLAHLVETLIAMASIGAALAFALALSQSIE